MQHDIRVGILLLFCGMSPRFKYTPLESAFRNRRAVEVKKKNNNNNKNRLIGSETKRCGFFFLTTSTCRVVRDAGRNAPSRRAAVHVYMMRL